MKILITGGAGYIGARAATHFLDRGHSVTVLDRLLFGAECLLPFLGHPRFRLIAADIRDTAKLDEAVAGQDAVVNLAALVGEEACAKDEAATWAINVDGAVGALEAAARAGVGRFVMISTCSNYGVSAPNVLAREDAPLNPLSLYAKSKVEAELRVLGSNLPIGRTVLRFGTICGLSPRMRFDLLISEMARAAARAEPISIYAPDAWRPFLHVADAAAALETVLGADAAVVDGQVFNIVGENVTKRGLCEILQRHFPDARIEITDKKPDLRDYRVDAGRAAAELGFRPALGVEAAFRETAAAVAAGVFRDPMAPHHTATAFDAAALR